LRRKRPSDLSAARKALERAWSLDPTNGYFVGLLLDVLRAQGDSAAANDVLEWAWWRGAPVERWLPGGPPIPAHGQRTTAREATSSTIPSVTSPTPSRRHGAGSGTLVAGRQPVPA